MPAANISYLSCEEARLTAGEKRMLLTTSLASVGSYNGPVRNDLCIGMASDFSDSLEAGPKD